MRDFVKRAITDSRFPIDTERDRFQFAVATFSDSATVQFDFRAHRDLQSLVAAVDGLSHAGGNTDITTGLNTVRESIFLDPASGNRAYIPDILILITDGLDSERDHAAMDTQADLTKQAGITILSVGVGNNVDSQQLRNISSNDQAFMASNFTVLGTLLDELTAATCAAGDFLTCQLKMIAFT